MIPREPASITQAPAKIEKKNNAEEKSDLPNIKVDEVVEEDGKDTAKNEKVEQKEEPGFFDFIGDKVMNFFGLGDELKSDDPEKDLKKTQTDPLAEKTATKDKKDGAPETLNSERWFGKDKRNDPDKKHEDLKEYTVLDPILGHETKKEDAIILVKEDAKAKEKGKGKGDEAKKIPQKKCR